MPQNFKIQDLPTATIKRLPQYYRLFRQLMETGVPRTNSVEISQIIGIDPATVRRDFSLFGELGRRGYGYDTEQMRDFFAHLLGNDVDVNIALIGVGKLGSALLNYPFQRRNKLHIKQAYDISNHPLVGKKSESGVPIYNIAEIETKLKVENIETAILSVNTDSAQAATDKLVTAGIKGILNFTPVYLDVPDDVYIRSIDLTKELQTLIFFENNNPNISDNK